MIDRNKKGEPNDLVAYYSATAADKLLIICLGSNVMNTERKLALWPLSCTHTHSHANSLINKVKALPLTRN